MKMKTMRLGVVCGLAVAGVAEAGNFTTSYGIEFSTIGDAGNRAPLDSEAFVPDGNPNRFGAVDYEYRIATKELTVGQWYEFATAYLPFYDSKANTGGPWTFTSEELRFGFGNQSLVPSLPNAFERSVQVGWEYAARYANWLHNGKVNEAWAFESGAYDTSTFTRNEDGSLNHQRTPSPGARFWLPNPDEWTKAAFYDPDRYGDGEGGYWMYPNGSDEQPIPSHPGEGGETSSGLGMANDGTIGLYAPMSYPEVRSPWGLWDASGNAGEWLSNFPEDQLTHTTRAVTSSLWSDFGVPGFNDSVNWSISGHGMSWTTGFRLAAAVPSPGGVIVLSSSLLMVLKQRRR